jgi:hypothetical protein
MESSLDFFSASCHGCDVRFLCASVLVVACNGGGGGGNATVQPAGSSAPTKHGSAGGFSASLSADMAADTAPGSAAPTTAAGSTTAPAAGLASTTGSATTTGSGAIEIKIASPSTGVGIGSDKTVTNHDVSKADTNGAGPDRPTEKHVHVTPPPELAAVKLDLEPNWDRDYDEAGTISFVLRVPSSTDTRLFSFNYGYDYPGAPSDRDAYKKFLSDRRVLDVTLDRQRGAAWYLEGTDAAGAPAFRYLVVYGGKRLVCYGSLYKTKEATALGADLRDKVVTAAKKICETLAL